jgi:hypothetical protein
LAMLRGVVGRAEPVEILDYHGVTSKPGLYGKPTDYLRGDGLLRLSRRRNTESTVEKCGTATYKFLHYCRVTAEYTAVLPSVVFPPFPWRVRIYNHAST